MIREKKTTEMSRVGSLGQHATKEWVLLSSGRKFTQRPDDFIPQWNKPNYYFDFLTQAHSLQQTNSQQHGYDEVAQNSNPRQKKTSTKTHHRLNRTMWLACPRADACGKVDHSVRLLCPLFRANSVFSKALSKSLLSWTYSIPGTSASLYVIMNNLQVQNTAESTLLNISFYLQRGCWEIWLAKN